jgi:hypothetical protein
MSHFISRAREIFEYIPLIVSSTLVGGVVSAITGILAQSFLNNLLLGWKSLGIFGSIIGFVLGFCSVMKIEKIGSYMTDTVMFGGTTITYRDKIIEDNWFDYVFFFSARAHCSYDAPVFRRKCSGCIH